jgi:hypothetical protein
MQGLFVLKFWSKVEVSPVSKKRHLIHSMEQNPSWEAGSPSDGEEIQHPLPEPEDTRWSSLL